MRALPLLLLALALAPLHAQAQSTATYRVTFESTWSAATHPEDFPPDPHFSGLIGAAHDATATLWQEGALASAGIESMAETGGTAQLRAEVEAHIAGSQALAVLSGGGIALSPGSVWFDFEVTEDFPLVSLVTMIAPSPDWFVGVAGLSLREGDAWAAERVVDLYAYDAGTDSGTTYTAPDQDTQPREPIAALTDPPFEVNGTVPPLGTFTFTLLNVASAEDADLPASFALGAPTPNPASTHTTLDLRLGALQAVQIDVFDVLGRRVATLHDGLLPAGVHPFRLDVQALRGGVYFVRIRGADAQATRRFVVR